MPYSTDELDNLPFYQALIRQDEAKYLELIDKRTDSGTVSNGVLRDPNSGNIILFEKIIDGQGTDGTSYTVGDLHTLNYTDGYFDYEDTEEELNKIIKREFTEL